MAIEALASPSDSFDNGVEDAVAGTTNGHHSETAESVFDENELLSIKGDAEVDSPVADDTLIPSDEPVAVEPTSPPAATTATTAAKPTGPLKAKASVTADAKLRTTSGTVKPTGAAGAAGRASTATRPGTTTATTRTATGARPSIAPASKAAPSAPAARKPLASSTATKPTTGPRASVAPSAMGPPSRRPTGAISTAPPPPCHHSINRRPSIDRSSFYNLFHS